ILQNPFSVLGTVRDIQMADDGRGVAVGDNSILLYTENNGAIWSVAEDPVGISYRDIEIVKSTNSEVIFAAGQKLIRSSDSGKTWEKMSLSLTNIEGMSSINSSTMFIANLQQGVFKTTDGGETWEDLEAPGRFFREVHFIDEMNGFVATQQEETGHRMISTQDGGQTWKVEEPFCDFIGKIEFYNEMIGFCTTNCGIFKTADGGQSWNLMEGSPDGGTDLFVYDENTIWITWGLVYQFTNDGGQTWSERGSAGFGGDMEGVFVLDKNNIWMTGRNVGIAYTSDEGMTWNEQIPGSKANLNTISFVSENLGFAAGSQLERDVLLVTQDGGAIWEEKYIGDIIMNDMDNFDGQNIVVGGRRGAFHTADQGDNWDMIPNIGDNWIESVHYVDNNTIYLGGSSGRIWKTDVNGTNTLIEVSSDRFIEDIKFANPNLGYAVSTDGFIYRTSDGGDNWEEVHNQNEDLEKMYIKSDGTVIAIPRFAEFLIISEDQGQTWSQQMLNRSTFWGDMVYINDMTGYLVGGTSGTGIIIKTEDGGQTWESDYFSSNSFSGIAAPINGERLLWAAGAGGQIARFSECNASISISNLRGPEVYCKNDTIDVEVDFEGVDIFEWSVPEGWNIIGNNTSALIRVAVGDDAGTITVNAFNSCNDVTDTLQLTGTPLENPSPNISVDEVTLTCSTEAQSYQWFLNDSPINGATTSTYEAQETGDYYVEVTYSNGCTSSASNIINVVISSVIEIDGVTVTLHPNPATDRFRLRGLDYITHIQLWDMSGKLIRTYNPGQRSYSLEGVTSGLYLVNVRNGASSAIMKVIVQ
ncbi:MAG: T9SS type A sorting domain-containing protein, partial [Saprospiraceae bacterium]|nr:T9SS type A sorting domain-containing protein [Saprospiraceae bacterium]